MQLRFPRQRLDATNSPTLYATDQDSYVIQGWIVDDEAILAQLVIPDDETIVEVPAALLNHLSLDGLNAETRNLVPPIIHVRENGNYVIQGRRIADSKVLSQMSIPDHETCVHVSRSAVALLVGG